MTARAIAFVDGFNLYHSIDNDPALHKYKWLDLKALVRHFLTSTECLQEVRYFSAYTDWNPSRKSRHHAYVKVLESSGVKVTLGQFVERERTSLVRCKKSCKSGTTSPFCGKRFLSHEEKQTDVNIAVDILRTCFTGSCESVYLVTGDNDIVPALEAARQLFPKTHIRVLLPIHAKAKKMMASCTKNGFKYMRINATHLAASQFPNNVLVSGSVFSRPASWV